LSDKIEKSVKKGEMRMVIRYIGVINYEDIKKPININLGGPYYFELTDNKKLKVSISSEEAKYVYGLYKDITVEASSEGNEHKKKITYEGVSDVSAIIGENGSGKTTSLRIICGALGRVKLVSLNNNSQNVMHSIIIQEDIDNKQLYITSTFNTYNQDAGLVELNNDLRELGYKGNIKKLLRKDLLEKKQLVYFSNVFDKSAPFSASDNLIDISTNYRFEQFVNKSIDSTISKARWENNNNLGDRKRLSNSKTAKYDFERFKKEEILDRLALLGKYQNIENILMFKFPKKINMSFSEIIEEKDDIYSTFNGIDSGLELFQRNVNGFLNEIYDSDPANENNIKDQLAVFILEEIVLSSISDTNHDYDEISSRIWALLKKEKDRYGIELLEKAAEKLKLPDKISQKAKPVMSDEDPDEDELGGIAGLCSFYEKMIAMAEDYKYQINNFGVDDLYLYEFFDELKILFELTSKLVTQDYSEKIDAIMNPIWDGDISEYSIDVESIIEKINDCMDKFINELSENLDVYKTILNSESDNEKNVFETVNKSQKIDDTELADMAEKVTYEIVDKKIKNLFDLFSVFCEMADKEGSSVDELELNVEIRNNKNQATACKESFKEFCKKYFSITKKAYPNGIETFELVADHEPISSGYNGYFDMIARMALAAEEINDSSKNEVIFLLDEAELYLHPKAQRNFLLSFIKAMHFFYKGQNKEIQVVLASNSPFLLSDIQDSNVLYLKGINTEKGLMVCSPEEIGSPFGENISSLLENGFFMDDGAIGAIARCKINEVITRLNGEKYSDKNEKDKAIIDIIGDEYIKVKLKEMYEYKLQ
jgi:predicted ATP-dependent endonuclease of OLD family